MHQKEPEIIYWRKSISKGSSKKQWGAVCGSHLCTQECYFLSSYYKLILV